MFLLRFLSVLLFFSGLFFIPGIKAAACEMHPKTEQTKQQHETDAQKNCCNQSASKHETHQHSNGPCDHHNCTNNICHPMSVSSLHVAENIEIPALPAGDAHYVTRSNKMPPLSYTYSIWQPPRLG